MKTCHCTLGNTAACKTCPNGILDAVASDECKYDYVERVTYSFNTAGCLFVDFETWNLIKKCLEKANDTEEYKQLKEKMDQIEKLYIKPIIEI